MKCENCPQNGKCPSCKKAYDKEYYTRNKLKRQAQNAKWSEENREKKLKISNEYYYATKEQRREYNRLKMQRRRASNLELQIKERVTARIGYALKSQNRTKLNRTEELLGCTIEFYIGYLEAKFKEGMTWDNRALWHIDHIIPCASFDLTDEAQVKECFHYTNTQPLWASENASKSDRLCASP